ISFKQNGRERGRAVSRVRQIYSEIYQTGGGGQDIKDIPFRVKYDLDMGRVKRSYAALSGISVSLLTFLFDGRRVTDDITPRSMDMEDNDEIDVFHVYDPREEWRRKNDASWAELLGLHQKAMNHIYSFLTDKSLVRMRQACKAARDSIDCFIVHVLMTTQNTVIDTISVNGANGGMPAASSSLCA
ncbi:hypothetical protein PENTCL1PPCAC_28459, partial [Pristionchus entomophagus]